MTYRSELIQVAAVALAAVQNWDINTTKLHGEGVAFDVGFQQLMDEVYEERVRQEAKWGTRDEPPGQWLTVLVEEVGEVAKAILERDF